MLKVKCDLDLWPHTGPWPWIFMAKFWNSCVSEWEGRLTLHEGGGSRSSMTMAVTIWWPRSGVWIYQIVTSVVGVPSTHLVMNIILKWLCGKQKNRHQPFPTTNGDDILETIMCCKGYSLQTHLTNPTMHNTNIRNAPFCDNSVHMHTFLLQIGALWDIKLVHFVICEMGLCMTTWFPLHNN